MNKNKLKGLENQLNKCQQSERRVFGIPSHLKDKYKFPPNSMIIDMSADVLNKYWLSWEEDIEEFRIKKDEQTKN